MQTIIMLVLSVWVAGHPEPQQLAAIPQVDIAACLNAAATALEENAEVSNPDGSEISYKYAAACIIERSTQPGRPA